MTIRRVIPASFTRASWRGTTNTDAEGNIGVSFDLRDVTTIRLVLDRLSAENLADSVREFLAAYEAECAHSDNSSAIPSVEGSTARPSCEGQCV
jgi:hypothetical protein